MPEISPSRYLVQAGWDDVPHLDEQTKRELLEGTPPFLREARSKGIPSLGAGAIYPIAWEDVTVAPFAIPAYWPRAYGMDVGWNKTAATWLAKDPTDGALYAYSEYAAGQAVPVIHATAIKARGPWIRGAIDPASRGRSQDEGKSLMVQYRNAGLKILPAVNAVEPGLYRVWELLQTGRLKLFSTLQNHASEYRIYRRDENGKVVKKHDHNMDSLRYGVMTFDQIARVKPVATDETDRGFHAADTLSGY